MMTVRRGDDRMGGFTLVELLISMAVLSLILIALYSMFASGVGIYTRGDVKSEIQQNSRGAMELMVRDLRLAGFFPEDFPALFPGGAGACPPTPISAATATTITICGDVDRDNSSEQVTYTWVGDTNADGIVDPNENEIRRQVDGAVPAEVLALNMSAFQLSYFDATNTVIAVPVLAANLPNIRRVVITMTGAEPTQQSAAIGGRGGNAFAPVPDYQLITDVRMRNL